MHFSWPINQNTTARAHLISVLHSDFSVQPNMPVNTDKSAHDPPPHLLSEVQCGTMHTHACARTHPQIADSMSGAFPAVAWCQIAVSTVMPGINCSGVFECVCWTAGLLHIFTSLDISLAPTPNTHTHTRYTDPPLLSTRACHILKQWD